MGDKNWSNVSLEKAVVENRIGTSRAGEGGIAEGDGKVLGGRESSENSRK